MNVPILLSRQPGLHGSLVNMVTLHLSQTQRVRTQHPEKCLGIARAEIFICWILTVDRCTLWSTLIAAPKKASQKEEMVSVEVSNEA